ncbi:hypothetical protein E2542_SST12087 [Spatholobus suberectus]|nr:hypothetical protein E2542_SST12087 [Spatholobus suberectus]
MHCTAFDLRQSASYDPPMILLASAFTPPPFTSPRLYVASAAPPHLCSTSPLRLRLASATSPRLCLFSAAQPRLHNSASLPRLCLPSALP